MKLPRFVYVGGLVGGIALIAAFSAMRHAAENAGFYGIASTGSSPMIDAGQSDARGATAMAISYTPVPASKPAGAATLPAEQPADAISYLAYTYTISLELPATALTGTMDAHVRACREAGPRVCQVVSARRGGMPESDARGALALRAEPAWLQRFMAGVESAASAAGGRVGSKSTTTEDLTRAIVDTEATLRAKRSLRGRLEQLLAGHPGKLADFLEAERELARVQGEIDSIDSNLAAMRARVAMSALTIEYTSITRAYASDTLRPLHRAVTGFIGYVVTGVADIITLVAIVLPWIVVGVPIVWLVVRARRRARGAGDTGPAPPVTVEPPAAPAS
jgi:hypothetical protein